MKMCSGVHARRPSHVRGVPSVALPIAAHGSHAGRHGSGVRRGVALPVALRVLRGLPYDGVAGRHAHAEGAGVARAVLAERAGPECADGARLAPCRRVSPESGGAQVGASGWVCYDRVCRVVAREVACLGVGDVLAV